METLHLPVLGLLKSIHPGKSAYRPQDRADKVAALQMMVFAVLRGPLGWAKSMY